MADKKELYKIEWDLERKYRQEKDDMPLLGPKGKVARASFLCFGLVICFFVGIACSGAADRILPLLQKLGEMMLLFFAPLLILPSAYLTWKETWGKRFPLAAVASLAALVAICAVAAWTVGRAFSEGGMLDPAVIGEQKACCSLAVLALFWLFFGALAAGKFACWLDDKEYESIKREARAIYDAENAPDARKAD